MFQTIKNYIESLDISSIHEERLAQLDVLVHAIRESQKEFSEVQLNFICTHNSRRSHIAQIWASILADFYSIEAVSTYSGGTEATKVYRSVLSSAENIGLIVHLIQEGKNPHFSIHFGEDKCVSPLFSKRFDDEVNPKEKSITVMVCSDAAENCPYIPSVFKRVALPFKDPKEFDHTLNELQAYSEKHQEIATELKYVFHQLSK